MGQILEFLNQGWVGAVIGIISVLYAFIIYKISKIGTRLVYQWKSLKIISKGKKVPDEIEIIYKGKSVDRLIKTQIIIWNSGKKTVNGEDIVKEDPLKMIFSNNEEIISVNITKVTREINQFSYSVSEEEKNELNFKFGFLDPGDGVVLEIFHTDNNRYPKISGTIKGMPQGILNWSNKKGNKNKIIAKGVHEVRKVIRLIINSWIGNLVLLILGIFFFGISFIYLEDNSFIYNKIITESTMSVEEKKLTGLNWLLLGCAYSMLGGSLIWKKRIRVPKTLKNEFQDTLV
ncbi:hypothetical protein LIS82_22960 [Cytobacillus solani]|uniref:hypothetical protein n=1 Tax=Cytobacillus solani TaxID=1637975 RepID=UPI002079775E|nr:hypothetical protein [Cytobacillus solani]USK54383.1 hypothetical protein LIS82_22960 [Cytobacillus solani]